MTAATVRVHHPTGATLNEGDFQRFDLRIPNPFEGS